VEGKGLVQLIVEIDYENMLTDDKLEALMGFTGQKSKEGVIGAHMKMLGESLETIVKDKPFIKYSIDGRLVPNQPPQEQQEEVQENVVHEEPVVEVSEVIDRPVEVEEIAPVAPSVELVNILDEAIVNVSVEKGMPQVIKINGLMADSINTFVGEKVRNTNGVIEAYNGFPVMMEGMEEPFIIEYKEYGTGETGQYRGETK
jgi:acetylornithine deacetylase/succinyl-diaminopimelate desuccinylase-like protein